VDVRFVDFHSGKELDVPHPLSRAFEQSVRIIQPRAKKEEEVHVLAEGAQPADVAVAGPVGRAPLDAFAQGGRRGAGSLSFIYLSMVVTFLQLIALQVAAGTGFPLSRSYPWQAEESSA
jgi:hypothetical protein